MSRPASIRPLWPWLFALGLCGCYPSLPKDLASLGPLDTCPPFNTGELIDKARHFGHSTDSFTLRCALGQLRSTTLSEIHKTPTASKICFLLAERTVGQAEEQERVAAEGVRWAEIAQPKDAPKDGVVQYYYAVNLGLVIRNHITLAATHLSRLVKALEIAVELSPDVDRGGPYRALGLLYLMAPPWPQSIGDTDKALELLQQAVDRFPDHPLNQLFYAKALWEIQQEEARAAITERLQLASKLLADKDYAAVSEQWEKDIAKFAEEIQVSLAPHPPTPPQPPAPEANPTSPTPPAATPAVPGSAQ